MQSEAEAHAEEDKKKRELVDVLNQADQVIYSTENTLKEHGDKVSEADKENINQALEKLKKAKDEKNVDEIKTAIDELQEASHKLAQAMYEATAKSQQQAEGKGTEEKPSEKESKKGKGEEEVIDADYEVKD